MLFASAPILKIYFTTAIHPHGVWHVVAYILAPVSAQELTEVAIPCVRGRVQLDILFWCLEASLFFTVPSACRFRTSGDCLSNCNPSAASLLMCGDTTLFCCAQQP